MVTLSFVLWLLSGVADRQDRGKGPVGMVSFACPTLMTCRADQHHQLLDTQPPRRLPAFPPWGHVQDKHRFRGMTELPAAFLGSFLVVWPGADIFNLSESWFLVQKWQWLSYLLGVRMAGLCHNSSKPTTGAPQSLPQPCTQGKSDHCHGCHCPHLSLSQ